MSIRNSPSLLTGDAAHQILPTPSRPSGSFYRPELDVLRFFAFFSVFLGHALAPLVPEGDTRRSPLFFLASLARDTGGFGLCLFFLLSAYLISELLLRERSRTGTVHLRAFYARRILRIWPLYFAMLGLGYLVGLVRPDTAWGIFRFVNYLLLVGNLYAARHGFTANPAAPLWSVSVEEQFYLVWPSIVKRGAYWIAIASIAFIVVSFATIYILVTKGVSMQAVWVNSLVQFQFFGIGALIALWLQGRMPTLASPVRIAMLLGAIFLWLTANAVFDVSGIRGTEPAWQIMAGYGVVAIGCVLLCVGILGAPASWFPKVIVYLGKISYGLYVFHMLALGLVRYVLRYAVKWPGLKSVGFWPLAGLEIVIALGLTMVLAHLSYVLFETPFLRMKERFTFVQSRAI